MVSTNCYQHLILIKLNSISEQNDWKGEKYEKGRDNETNNEIIIFQNFETNEFYL